MHDQETAISLVTAFLDEPFSEDDRHIRRIQMLSDYESA
jgi:ribose 5-phosphate isomerase B